MAKSKLGGKGIAIFATLFYIGLIANIDKSFIGVVATTICTQYGYSASDFANITNLYYASNIVMTLVSGYIVDRFGYKPFMLACLSILAAASALFGLSGFIGIGTGGAMGVLMGLLASRFFVGIGQTGYTNGTAKAIVENFEPSKRRTVQSVVVATAGFGALLAYTLFSGLLTSFGWQAAYWILAALFVVATILMLVVVPKKHTPSETKVNLFTAWKNKNSLVLGFSLLCNNMVGVVSLVWLPSYLQSIDVIKEAMNSTPEMTSWILIGYAVVMGVAMVVSNLIIQAFFRGREKVFAIICSVIGAVFLYMMTVSTDMIVIIACLYIATFLLMLVFSAIVNLPYAELKEKEGTIVPVAMIASAYSVINICAFAGAMVGNTAVAGIADAFGFGAGFAALAVPFLLSGLSLFLLPKTK